MPQPRGQSDVRPPSMSQRPNSKGDSTRQLILETAERLFAERGIAAVPLRDVGLAAGQRNNVAVQYHFGDRETLLAAITRHRATASEKTRAELLADLLAGEQRLGVRDLVRVFVVSLAGHLREVNYYLAFLSRYIIEHGGYRGLEGVLTTSTVATMRARLQELLPDYPEAVLTERWTIMMTSTVHTLARYQTAAQAGTLDHPLDDLLDDLVTFLAAGLEAAPPSLGRPSARVDEPARVTSA